MKKLIEEYKLKFNEEPVIIGIYWSNPNILEQNILNAIKTGKKYNELDLLTDEQRKLFNKGKLLF
jgi:hypothetical protein